MTAFSTVTVFSASVGFMALKPLLLHLGGSRGSAPALPPALLQLLAELAKVVLCGGVLSIRRLTGGDAALWSGWAHTRGFSLPAAVYLLMNVLSIRAARLLPPPTFQLVANLKILFTAVAAKLVRGQDITSRQWCALVLLTLGVAVGQWRGTELTAGAGQGQLLGVLLTVVNSALSSLGGALTENVLKSAGSARLSIYARNIHLAAHTLVLNSLFILGAPYLSSLTSGDGAADSPLAALRTPSQMETIAVLNEAANGIIISFLIGRWDSITKNYAFGMSVFASAGLSAVFLQHRPTWNFYLGSCITFASLALSASSSKVATPDKDKKKE